MNNVTETREERQRRQERTQRAQGRIGENACLIPRYAGTQKPDDD